MFDQFASDPQENLLSSVSLTGLNSDLHPENAVIVPTSGLSTEQNLNQPVTVNPADSLLLSGIGGSDTTEAVTLVDNQSSDALTGEAMNIAKGKLIKLAQAPDFIAKMNVPFGENWNTEVANTVKQNWLNGDFSFIPPVEIVAKGEIAGANGAFAQATNTIYLSQKFLRENGTNSQAVADVLLEEIGHSIDSKINITDSPGDEGAIFAGIVQGNEWSHEELVSLKSQEDSLFINLHGQDISIEQASNYDNSWLVSAYKSGQKERLVSLWYNNTFTSGIGNKGFSRNWRSSSPTLSPKVPQDYVQLDLKTKADFVQGQTYFFRVRADDNYALRAIPANGTNSQYLINFDSQELITEWKWNNDAYKTKTIQFVPKQTGKYWIQANYQELTGDASLFISWDRNTVTVENKRFPVKLSLYDQYGKDLGRAKRNNIDPNKDTIVVIHGRGDGNPDGNIMKLAEAAATSAATSNYYPNSQVLYLDWKEAANDPGKRLQGLTPYEAAKRIRPVAQWAVEKLKNLGITPAKTILLGHSLGSYVASEIGRLGGQVKELVALDPAAVAPMGYLGPYDIDGNNPGPDTPVDFNTVATKSIALVATDAHGDAGRAGDNYKASSADDSYIGTSIEEYHEKFIE